MAETQTVLKNKTLTLALSNPSSKTTQSQLEDIVKNIRLAHINDVNTLNEQIKRRDEIIDEQNDIIEDLLDEREAVINEEPQRTKIDCIMQVSKVEEFLKKSSEEKEYHEHLNELIDFAGSEHHV